MSSISMSLGDGDNKSSRRPDNMRCQARDGLFCCGSALIVLTFFVLALSKFYATSRMPCGDGR